MTRTKSLRGQRAQIASHFKVVEVPMKSLNDPLPPYHAPSPDVSEIAKCDDWRYYKIDLSQLKLINQNHSEDHEKMKENPKKEEEETTDPFRYFQGNNLPGNDDVYPSVSHGTRNLLREVANIRQQYKDRSSMLIS